MFHAIANIRFAVRPLAGAVLFCAAALAAGCGGGGGGSAGGGGGGGGVSYPAPAPTPATFPVNAVPGSISENCNSACQTDADSHSTFVDFRNSEVGQIRAQYAYGRGFYGQGVTVAVADTGVDSNHPEFLNRLAPFGYNAVDNGAYPEDLDGHGTGVAGIIAAARNNDDSMGVAFQSVILPVKVGVGETARTDLWGSAINRALQNAFVVNNSWGSNMKITADIGGGTMVEGSVPAENAYDPHRVAAYRNADNHDSIVVFAAGNDGLNTETGRSMVTIVANPGPGQYVGQEIEVAGARNFSGYWPSLPRHYPELIGHWLNVVAVDGSNTIAEFSNGCGDTKTWCLAAPGVRIIAPNVGGGRQIGSGTSFAAPHVSGAAAVLKSAFPNLGAKQIVRLLLITARDLGDAGVDDVYGYGLVDLERATRPQIDLECGDGYQCPRNSRFRVAYSHSAENDGLALDDFSVAALADSRIVASPALSPKTQNVPVGFLDGFDRAYQANLDHFVSAADAPRSGFFFQPHLRDRILRNGFYALGATGDAPLAFGWKTKRGGVSADFFEVRPGGGARVSAARPGTDFAFALGAERARGMAVVSPNFIAGFSRAEGGNGADFHQAALAFSRDGAGWNAAWETGLAVERGSALGAKFGGAFAVRRARTLYGRLAGSFALSPRARIFAAGTVGRTRADAGSGAVASFSELRSRGWEAGVAGDSWRLSYSRPLRTSSGEMRLRTAAGYDESGGYVVRESRADLSSSRSWRAAAEWTNGKTTRLRSEIGDGRRVNVAAEFLF